LFALDFFHHSFVEMVTALLIDKAVNDERLRIGMAQFSCAPLISLRSNVDFLR
jgi:hypothetical protein